MFVGDQLLFLWVFVSLALNNLTVNTKHVNCEACL